MWGTLFKQASRLAQEGYSREEVQEILKRATELQAQAESQQEQKGQGLISKGALRAGAIAAGIRPEFLERALQEFHERREKQSKGKHSKGKNWGRLASLLLVGIFVLPVALLVFGTLAFAFGVTLSALLTVGAALLIAGFIILFAMSPLLGVGFLIGLATVMGHMLAQFQKRGSKRKRRWRRWLDDDD